jgi:hypothetical protein
LDQCLEGELCVGQEAVAHGRSTRIIGVGGDLQEFGAFRKIRPRNVAVIVNHAGPHDDNQVVAL